MPYITRETVRRVTVFSRHWISRLCIIHMFLDIYPIDIIYPAHLNTVFIGTNSTNCDFGGAVSFLCLFLRLFGLQMLTWEPRSINSSSCVLPCKPEPSVNRHKQIISNEPKYLVDSILRYTPVCDRPWLCSNWPPLTVTVCWPIQLEACPADPNHRPV